MEECPVSHPVLPGLFDPHIPNNPALWAVFQGRHSGRAFVDGLEENCQCLVRTDAALTYASRKISREFLWDGIKRFKHIGPIWLVRSPTDPPAPDGYRASHRLEFYGYDSSSSIREKMRSSLPAGHYLQPIDLNLLQRCEWRDDMAFYCGSLENFLCNGLGLCLMRGEEILVEAYASALGDRYAEIGAVTQEPFRGRGLAPIAVAYLIEMLEHRGYSGYWSCDIDNQASVRVARKLGFTTERRYEIWEYQADNS